MRANGNGAVVADPVSAETERPVDPYEKARNAAEAAQTSEERLTDTFRRQNVIQYAVIALLAASNLVGWLHHSVETKIVYTDRSGASADGGSALDVANPTDAMVAYQLREYVKCIRTVSNDDLALDNCRELVVDFMTQNIAPGHAKDDVEAYYRANNPKALARTMTRSVLNDRDHPIHVTRLGDSNTYELRWFEKVHDFARGDSWPEHVGSVVIAPPFIPLDDTFRRKDPPGVVVTGFSLL